MSASSALAHHQVLGDLTIRGSLGHQCEHLALARCQVVAGLLRPAQRVGEQTRDRGIQVHLPGVRGAHRLGDLVSVGVLEQVTRRPRLECPANLGLLHEAGQGDHLDGGPVGLDLAGCGDAVHLRH